MKRIYWIGLICLLVVGCSKPLPLEEVQAYRCPASSVTLEIDGKLDEADWSRAEKLPINLVFRPLESSAPIPKGSVQLLWDEQYLYVGFSCEDDDIWSYGEIPDEDMWLGDVVELFVKPSRDHLNYFEFVVAPNAVMYDAHYASRGSGTIHRFRTWSSEARVASQRDGTDGDWKDDDRGYTVEIAIPWSAFSVKSLPPVGETWTFGAFRYDYSKSYEDPYLLMTVPASTHGFHSYEAYQDIHFVEE